MHRSSETVAAIATALAKAQIELSNPEKTAVGLISNASRGEGDRTFRYAPLSAGLDLVRKSLGGQQIAILQTTEIDRPSGTVNLTTVLMHTSGEWISSDWPVCQLTEAAAPRQMGAAITYARRYALFSMVGIAGEDDLDTPTDATPATAHKVITSLAPDPSALRPSQARNGSMVREKLSAEASAVTGAELIRDIETLPAKGCPGHHRRRIFRSCGITPSLRNAKIAANRRNADGHRPVHAVGTPCSSRRTAFWNACTTWTAAARGVRSTLSHPHSLLLRRAR